MALDYGPSGPGSSRSRINCVLFLGKLRYRPHRAGVIWKRSFISTVRPTVHTNPPWKRSFSKTLVRLKEFENTGSAPQWRHKTFWKRSFSNTMASWFPWLDFPQTQIQNHLQCCRVFKCLRRSVDGKHLMCFQSETSVHKFLRRSVDGALVAHKWSSKSRVRSEKNLRDARISLVRNLLGRRATTSTAEDFEKV